MTKRTLPQTKVQDIWMTLAEVLGDIGVPLATWSRWQSHCKRPRLVRLPNRQLPIRRSWLEEWREYLEVAAIPSLHAAIAHDLWEEALPDGLDPVYAAHVVAIYKSSKFGWTPSRHAVNTTDRQSVVDALIAAGGRIDASALIAQGGKQKAMFWRNCGRPQQLGKSPLRLPSIQHMGEWAQGPAGKHERFYKLIDCPHCGGHASEVVRTLETTACLLCPACRRMPIVDSPQFPDEYFHLTPRLSPRSHLMH